MFKIEVEDDKDLWSDMRSGDGKALTFELQEAARAALAERFPVLVSSRFAWQLNDQGHKAAGWSNEGLRHGLRS